MEHLIEVGIAKIIRIGGNSSSEILEGKNLRVVSKTEGKTGTERHTLGKSYEEREQQQREVNYKLRILRGLRKTNWASFSTHLRRTYPAIHSQFSGIDSEGFVMASNHNSFELWAAGKGEDPGRLDKPLENLKTILSTANSNVYRLAIADRTVLVEYWVEEIQRNITAEAFDGIQHEDSLRQRIQDVHDEVDRRVLTTADVIGVTTSGLAKRISVLRHINAQVVVCEEAGEVL